MKSNAPQSEEKNDGCRPQGEPPPAPGSGHWLLEWIRGIFKTFWEQANVEYYQALYDTDDTEEIADRLIRWFARNASFLGALTGVLMSVDEVIAFATGGEGGIGLPVNILIAILVLSMETVLLIRFQLALVACLGKVYGMPLDPNDPEDVLTIFAYALGGSAANAAGAAGMKVGGKLVARIAKSVAQKEAVSTLEGIAGRLGLRFLGLAMVKYAIPLVSIGIGIGANYLATKAVGNIAKRHLRERRNKPAGRPRQR